MASERPDKGDLYQQAGHDIAKRHEREYQKQMEEIRIEREEAKRALQFETEEHRARMMRILKERHTQVIESLEKEQRQERTGERDTPEAQRARNNLQRQAEEEQEQEKAQDEQEFADDRAYVDDRIDQLIDKAERKEEHQRQWAEKRGIDPAEAAQSVRREYEEKIREWEKHRDEWAEKTAEERNRLLEQLDRSITQERDPHDWDRPR